MALRTSMLNSSQTSTVLTTSTMPGPKASRARLGRCRMREVSGGLIAQAACNLTKRSCLYESLAATSGCATASLQQGKEQVVAVSGSRLQNCRA